MYFLEFNIPISAPPDNKKRSNGANRTLTGGWFYVNEESASIDALPEISNKKIVKIVCVRN
jgi:hypothetical protein